MYVESVQMNIHTHKPKKVPATRTPRLQVADVKVGDVLEWTNGIGDTERETVFLSKKTGHLAVKLAFDECSLSQLLSIDNGARVAEFKGNFGTVTAPMVKVPGGAVDESVLIKNLRNLGFKAATSTEWHSPIRYGGFTAVRIEDNVIVYKYETSKSGARLMAWKAEFTNAPFLVVNAVIEEVVRS